VHIRLRFDAVVLTAPAVTTAVFSVCGMDVGTYLVAAVLSLPKQFAAVYLGWAVSLSTAQRSSLPRFTPPHRR
jgi:hypothetical protein